jgi:hypothetical protein
MTSRKEVYYLTEETKNLLKIYDKRAKELKKSNTIFGHVQTQFYKDLENYERFKDLMTESNFKEVLKFKRNRKQRRRRANKKLRPILCSPNNRVVFGTCTFNDEQFFKKNGEPIQERTRTKKVNEWLQRHFKYSVVNIDYGERTEREHHHFIGEPNDDVRFIPVLNKDGSHKKSRKGHFLYNLDLPNQDYDLGFEPDIELIEYDGNDYYMKRISNYLLKITNHINKATTKNRRFRVLKGINI